jgi:hypothetical protein
MKSTSENTSGLIIESDGRTYEWFDLFLRSARSAAFEGWEYRPGPCWCCGLSGLTAAIDLYPLGGAFGAELCFACRSLRVSFSEQQPGELTWPEFKPEAEAGLRFAHCRGGSGGSSGNEAVRALRRAVLQAERAEQAGWKGVEGTVLTLVTGQPPTRG